MGGLSATLTNATLTQRQCAPLLHCYRLLDRKCAFLGSCMQIALQIRKCLDDALCICAAEAS